MSKQTTINVTLGLGFFIVWALLTWGGWSAKRWLNWKFSYSAKVNLSDTATRLDAVEKRLDELERK